MSAESRKLVQTMATANPLWGAPRNYVTFTAVVLQPRVST
jgi:hypothetical protein